ncbi:hypothetical protein POM88_025632 [Heracleum sosnowskyi]|uniref:Uncharacterized protein n=1 Tax=Heracleum sosnowskyi TaxID=360622 RepID=A0AAD8MN39_9APIA|nr:hypothetical protein POM88_025631 [Heracleum sosnowskyi]KAK1378888.1 hypothetical protein POM88_025632 [Heracleum sosnowskyi]
MRDTYQALQALSVKMLGPLLGVFALFGVVSTFCSPLSISVPDGVGCVLGIVLEFKNIKLFWWWCCCNDYCIWSSYDYTSSSTIYICKVQYTYVKLGCTFDNDS